MQVELLWGGLVRLTFRVMETYDVMSVYILRALELLLLVLHELFWLSLTLCALALCAGSLGLLVLYALNRLGAYLERRGL